MSVHDNATHDDQSEVMDYLGQPATHGLDAPPVRIDTHAASVFLAGPDAYKIKRAVQYPYLDFSTLERRKSACEAEIRLNRPNAPEIYLGVVPIVRRADGLHIGGAGEIVEWAVHMRRFDPESTLDRLADRNELSPGILAELVDVVVAAHVAAPARHDSGTTARIASLISDNASELREASLFADARIDRLGEEWRKAFEDARAVLRERERTGHVRRCHGDLHLGNIVLIDGRPRLFDALEFDEALATTDELHDLAFLLMDLWDRGLKDAANVTRNRYLWARDNASDLSACRALPLFMSLRAAIRAKVAVAKLNATGNGGSEVAARRYLATAESCMASASPGLVAIGGLSGTGKTTIAAALAPLIGVVPGAVHLRSDIERKRMFGVGDTERLPRNAYRESVTADVYDRLRWKAARALDAGQTVVVDAVHDRKTERAAIEKVAREAVVPFAGIWLDAEEGVLLERVASRQGDASDADIDVVKLQLARQRDEVEWHRLASGGGVDDTVAALLEVLTTKSPAGNSWIRGDDRETGREVGGRS